MMPFQCPACKTPIRVPKPLTLSFVNKETYSMILAVHPEDVSCPFCKVKLVMFIPQQIPAMGYIVQQRESGIMTPSQAALKQ